MRGDILVVHRWMFMKLTAFLVNMINNIWLWKNPYEQWLYSSGAPWKIDNWGEHISYINVLHLFLQFVNTNIWICAPLPQLSIPTVTDLESIVWDDYFWAMVFSLVSYVEAIWRRPHMKSRHWKPFLVSMNFYFSAVQIFQKAIKLPSSFKSCMISSFCFVQDTTFL